MKKLSKEEMKKVIGGVLPQCPEGEASCTTNSNCGYQQACMGVPGCCESDIGHSCSQNSDCGNNLTCVPDPYAPGKNWCNSNGS